MMELSEYSALATAAATDNIDADGRSPQSYRLERYLDEPIDQGPFRAEVEKPAAGETQGLEQSTKECAAGTREEPHHCGQRGDASAGTLEEEKPVKEASNITDTGAPDAA